MKDLVIGYLVLFVYNLCTEIGRIGFFDLQSGESRAAWIAGALLFLFFAIWLEHHKPGGKVSR